MARFDFQELVERLPLVVYVDKLDDKSSPLYVSPQIAQLMGYSQEEWLADPDLFTAPSTRTTATGCWLTSSTATRA